MDTGVLYLVSTPIGNLKDITLRALDVLKNSEIILCEDTRVSIKLMNAYEIKKPLSSLHKFNELQKLDEIKHLLDDGKIVSLISDAGTPLISDPGVYIVPKLLNDGYSVVPIPGASAILPAIQLSGMVYKDFYFAGFLPDKKEEFFKSIENLNIPIYIYESPHKINKTLELIMEYFGDIDVVIVREITKHFETRHFGKISALLSNEYKGEIVLGFIPPKKIVEYDWIKMGEPYKKAGFSTKDISKILSIQTGVGKNEIYPFFSKN
ncbi:16S rRNA (cytidine(1402)-2'-O)-methyltransferase [bacterium]|nr:16S rRNA (cytidine(1402)-2'-O)-methyltransferase [bacterium]